MTEIDERRLVLLGKTHAGKSSTGNTILLQKCFPTDRSHAPITLECITRQTLNKAMRLRYTVMDTPGFWDDTGLLPDVGYLIQQQILKLCDEPHAFLLVVDPDDCRDTMQLVDVLRTWFGMTMLEHTIVVFTKAYMFKSEESFKKFIQAHALTQLVDLFSERVIRIENHGDGRWKSLRQLLLLVERMSSKGSSVFQLKRCIPSQAPHAIHTGHATCDHNISDVNNDTLQLFDTSNTVEDRHIQKKCDDIEDLPESIYGKCMTDRICVIEENITHRFGDGKVLTKPRDAINESIKSEIVYITQANELDNILKEPTQFKLTQNIMPRESCKFTKTTQNDRVSGLKHSDPSTFLEECTDRSIDRTTKAVKGNGTNSESTKHEFNYESKLQEQNFSINVSANPKFVNDKETNILKQNKDEIIPCAFVLSATPTYLSKFTEESTECNSYECGKDAHQVRNESSLNTIEYDKLPIEASLNAYDIQRERSNRIEPSISSNGCLREVYEPDCFFGANTKGSGPVVSMSLPQNADNERKSTESMPYFGITSNTQNNTGATFTFSHFKGIYLQPGFIIERKAKQQNHYGVNTTSSDSDIEDAFLETDYMLVRRTSDQGSNIDTMLHTAVSEAEDDTVLAMVGTQHAGASNSLNRNLSDSSSSLVRYARKPLTQKDVHTALQSVLHIGLVTLRNMIGGGPLASLVTIRTLARDEEIQGTLENVANTEEVRTLVDATRTLLAGTVLAIRNIITNVARRVKNIDGVPEIQKTRKDFPGDL